MRRVTLPFLGLLALLGRPPAWAEEAEPAVTPRPPPTAVLPRLTPLGAGGTTAPQALAPLLPVPVLGMPAPSSAMEPSTAAPPREAAPIPSPAAGTTAAPLPARKPSGPAPTAVAESAPANRFKGGYAKASKEDRGCALPGHITEERGADTRRPTIAVGTRVRVRAAANLRVAPFCDAKVADVLERGETVTVLAAFGSWYEVGRNGRALGFVGASLLAGAKDR
ncbi:SH3 domain-containing protein [Azospirillum argentinense]